jgi:peptide-methionine (R)-S-oxide reductase
MQRSDEEWKQKLTPEQYHVLRGHGTEPPFSGKLLANKEKGEYACVACGTVLFKSDAKYESNTPGLAGWPSFSEVASSDKVQLVEDLDWGMRRTEVICKTCGSHLGHVFDDTDSPTGTHYCINSTINSTALDFKKQ